MSTKAKEVTLQGERLLHTDSVKGKQIKKMVAQESIACLYELQVEHDMKTSDNMVVPATLRDVLENHKPVFEEPKTLPPIREAEHSECKAL